MGKEPIHCSDRDNNGEKPLIIVSSMVASFWEGSPFRRSELIIHDSEVVRAQSVAKPKGSRDRDRGGYQWQSSDEAEFTGSVAQGYRGQIEHSFPTEMSLNPIHVLKEKYSDKYFRTMWQPLPSTRRPSKLPSQLHVPKKAGEEIDGAICSSMSPEKEMVQ